LPAYFSSSVAEFLELSDELILGRLTTAAPGSLPTQVQAWREQIALLKEAFGQCRQQIPHCTQWILLLEDSYYRLRYRLDAVLLCGRGVVILEFKTGAQQQTLAARRQAEAYAVGLRDFLSVCQRRPIFPAVVANTNSDVGAFSLSLVDYVARAATLSPFDLFRFLCAVASMTSITPDEQLSLSEWSAGEYRPVPTVLEAAKSLYSRNNVEELRATLSSRLALRRTTERIIEIIDDSRRRGVHSIVFVTGVPGSGKTLVGLNAVHDERVLNAAAQHHAVYLSGNTPLVEVLQSALARDASAQKGTSIRTETQKVRFSIQHIIRFLRQYLEADGCPAPVDGLIVFDEAQRAWDAEYGRKKFGRPSSEPRLIIEIMSRRKDWATIVALVGGGQEIHKGEFGLSEWGKALTEWHSDTGRTQQWEVIASPHVLGTSEITSGGTLWNSDERPETPVLEDAALHLDVSVRSHRNEVAAAWVNAVLSGDSVGARELAKHISPFPIYWTRDLDHAKSWARSVAFGDERVGLLCTSRAKRLRGYGLGATLTVADVDAIVHWHVAPTDDVRSSNALEVTGTEYAVQGLELDHCVVCWDGDMHWSTASRDWRCQTFSGTAWKATKDSDDKRFTANAYRVLLTRARNSMVIWLPPGDARDRTRPASWMNATADYLASCGVRSLSSWHGLSTVAVA
jgi:hypothetical protein